MTATTFNALAAARSLKAAGIEAEHAEGMREAAGADRDDVATKDDLAHFATKADLAELETRLRAATRADLYRGIGALRSEMRWMLGFQAALIVAVAAKLFGIV